MRRFLCRLFTRGKHTFRLKDFRYRCFWCGELRMHMFKPTPFVPTAGIEIVKVGK